MAYQAGYEIDTDPPSGRISFTFRGFWNEGDTARFSSDLADALGRMAAGGARPGHYLGLIDVREQAILSPEMVERFQAFADGPGLLAQRTAVVVNGSLQAMQMRRIGHPPRYAFFRTMGEALSWLERTRRAA